MSAKSAKGGVRLHRVAVVIGMAIVFGYAWGVDNPDLWMFLRGFAFASVVHFVLGAFDD